MFFKGGPPAMSTVLRSVAATAPINTSMEALTKRLLALRTEIDAILEQLAQPAADGEATAAPVEPMAPVEAPVFAEPTAEVEAPTAEQPVIEARAAEPAGTEPAPTATATEAETELTTQTVPERAGTAEGEVPTTCDAANAGELVASAPIEGEFAAVEPADVVAPATDAAAAHEMALADTAIEPIAADEAVPATEAPAQEPSQTAPPAEAAMMQPAMQAVEAVVETPAEATVISLDAHRPSGTTALQAIEPTAERRRPSRVKIAACVLMGLAVATLVFADLAALGSAPSNPHSVPSAAPLASSWSFQRLLRKLQPSAAPGAIDPQASMPLIEGFLISDRYRAAWPSGS